MKVVPSQIEFTLPSPKLGIENTLVIDSPWETKIKTKINNTIHERNQVRVRSKALQYVLEGCKHSICEILDFRFLSFLFSYRVFGPFGEEMNRASFGLSSHHCHWKKGQEIMCKLDVPIQDVSVIEFQMLLATTTSRKKQKSDLVQSALQNEEAKRKRERQNFHITSVPILTRAAHEPSLYHGSPEEPEESE